MKSAPWVVALVVSLLLGYYKYALHHAHEQLMSMQGRRESCNCTMLGGSDATVMGFDTFVVGEAHATPGQMDSMLIPARTVCGPMRLRAVLGGEP